MSEKFDTLQAAKDRASVIARDTGVIAGITEIRFSYFDAILAYEEGELGENETLELFQYLVDSGLAWQLQGSYGRTANSMIDAGLIEIVTKSEFDENPRKDGEDFGEYVARLRRLRVGAR